MKDIISHYDRECALLEGRVLEMKKRHSLLKKKQRKDKRHLSNLESAAHILRNVAEATQKQLTVHLSSVVTHCVRDVFGPQYEFNAVLSTKRGKTEIDFILSKEGNPSSDITLSYSGGATDVCSFALRVSCLLLTNYRRVLILDESFKHLAPVFHPLVAKMLNSLHSKLHIQFIVISHSESLRDHLEGEIIEL